LRDGLKIGRLSNQSAGLAIIRKVLTANGRGSAFVLSELRHTLPDRSFFL
jgi:hypothetical protein